MNNRYKMTLVAALLLAVAVAVSIGVIAYNLGVPRGLAESAKMVSSSPGTPYVYVWPKPWGFGFVFPVLFIVFWFFVVRARIWRAPWAGAWYRDSGVPPMFEEWHRRTHAQAGGQLSPERKG